LARHADIPQAGAIRDDESAGTQKQEYKAIDGQRQPEWISE